MKVRLAYFILMSLLINSCKRFEDASPTSRISLVHFYGGTLNYQGAKAREDQDGGFVIVGNIIKNDFVTDMIVIKTNSLGKTIWEKVFPSSSASDIKVVADGYLIAGDGIDYQPNASSITELVNTRARLIKMGFDQSIVFDYQNKQDSILVQGKYAQKDYHGSAVTLDNSGDIIFLQSVKSPEELSLQTTYVAGLDAATGNIIWTQTNYLDALNYINSNAIHLTSGNRLLWATTAEIASQSITNAYVSIIYTHVNSIQVDNPKYGDNNADHYYTGADIQGSGETFGIIGTFAKNDGTSANIYFIRAVATDHSIIMAAPKYFDGNNTGALSDPSSSQFQDIGNAITGTQEGSFVLAGSMLSTPTVGNGGRDILLIKVDPFGGFLWTQLIGGSGDETVSSILETTDGGLLVCGTNTVNNLSTIFLMKTNKNGELIN